MSRSYKKHNFTGFTTAKSEKQDKQIENRRLRRKANIVQLKLLDRDIVDDIMFDIIKKSGSWMFAKDGKALWTDDFINEAKNYGYCTLHFYNKRGKLKIKK